MSLYPSHLSSGVPVEHLSSVLVVVPESTAQLPALPAAGVSPFRLFGSSHNLKAVCLRRRLEPLFVHVVACSV